MRHTRLHWQPNTHGNHGRFSRQIFWLLNLLLLFAGITAVASAQSGGLDVDYGRYWNTSPGPMPEHLTHHSFVSSYLNPPYNEVGLVVYTPPGYENAANQNRRYPVIYTLHGVNGDELNYFSWFPNLDSGLLGYIEGTAITDQTIPEAIVVIVNGGKQSFYNDFTDQFHGPNSDFPIQSESILVNEVIPFVDANYRTIASGNGRGIEGFSMGGRGALKLAMKYPELFCSAIAYAGAAYEEVPIAIYNQGPHASANRLSTILSQNAARIEQTNLRLHLVVGALDNPRVIENDTFSAQLTSSGVPHTYETITGIDHDFTALYAALGDVGAARHGDCFAANNGNPVDFSHALYLPAVLNNAVP